MPLYLIHYAYTNLDFRIQELNALADYFYVELNLDELNSVDLSHPFVILTLPSNDIAVHWIQRSVLAKSIYEFLDQGTSYPSLFSAMQTQLDKYRQYQSLSFRFDVETFYHTRTLSEKVELMNQFHFLPFSGRIDLKNPQVKFTIFEVYEKDAEIKEPKLIYFGAKLSDSSRHVLSKYALPQRTYLGTTSMDPELSFLMAHLALVRRGDIVYDPCVGTASILLACAHLGAYCYGSDMDGRTIRGISPTQNVLSNYQQYQLQSQMLDHMVAPLQQFRFRIPFCQAVITDPPYGIREQQKKHTVHLQDLFDFAHQALVDYGRLVFVWPYMLSEEKKIPFDSRFAFIDLCIQSFGKWERRIYTYSKTPLLDQVHVSLQELDLSPSYKCNETVKAFRDAYFKPREEKKGSS